MGDWDQNDSHAPETGMGGHTNWGAVNNKALNRALDKWLARRGLKTEYDPYSVLGEYSPEGKKKREKKKRK